MRYDDTGFAPRYIPTFIEGDGGTKLIEGWGGLTVKDTLLTRKYEV